MAKARVRWQIQSEGTAKRRGQGKAVCRWRREKHRWAKKREIALLKRSAQESGGVERKPLTQTNDRKRARKREFEKEGSEIVDMARTRKGAWGEGDDETEAENRR